MAPGLIVETDKTGARSSPAAVRCFVRLVDINEGGTFTDFPSQHLQIAQMLAAPNQIVDQTANGLPFTGAMLTHFDPEFFLKPAGHPRPLGKIGFCRKVDINNVLYTTHCIFDDLVFQYIVCSRKFATEPFTFRPRKSKDRFGRYFTNFTPAVSTQAAKGMRQAMRCWALHRRSDKALGDLARMFNPVLQGWLNYYGSYYRSALHPTFRHLDDSLTRWAKQKYERLRGHPQRVRHWLQRIRWTQPDLFAHWQFFQSTAGQ